MGARASFDMTSSHNQACVHPEISDAAASAMAEEYVTMRKVILL